MRTQRELIWLVLAGVFASAVGVVGAVGLTATPAQACSVEAPTAFIEPSSNVRAGDWVSISGRGFWDLVWAVAPQPAQTQPAPEQDDAAAVPPVYCDFTTLPMPSIAVTWVGKSKQVLGTVDGPEFEVTVQIPDDGTVGVASIVIGDVWVEVSLGSVVDPPTPCAYPDEQGIIAPTCPEPWPCALYGEPEPAQISPDAVAQIAPECPCADYAASGNRGADHALAWDCPPPCAEGRPHVGAAVWCPPEPCRLVGGDAWSCPEPCPVYLAGDAVGEASSQCPAPCGVDDVNAVWCPPPCFGGRPDAAVAPGECPPEPCGQVGGDAWSCPEPCGQVGGDAEWCLAPHREPVADTGLSSSPPVAPSAAPPSAVRAVARPTTDAEPPAPLAPPTTDAEPQAADVLVDSRPVPTVAQDPAAPRADFTPVVVRRAQSAQLTELVNRAVRNVLHLLFG